MSTFPGTYAFGSATVILPVVNETYSLVETVDSILATSKPDVRELLIVVCDKTTRESMATIESLSARLGDLVVVHHQKLKFLGGAMREAFDLARGTHTIMMASDLETDPALVPRLIAEARANPSAVVTVTRWHKDGSFENYSGVKLIANWIFQKLFSALYWTNLTDMTYAYRIFPTKLLQAIKWEELRHPFLFETMIKPLRLGVKAIEIPGAWRSRTEGESQNTFGRNFEYFRIGLRVRFADARDLLRNGASDYQGLSRPSEHHV
jgi:glycosyltransferase involved in cell wall biosynthesis